MLDMLRGNEKSRQTPAASTGKDTLNYSRRAKEPPSLKPSEYVEEISDSENSDEERSIGSDAEERAMKLENTARRPNQETHEMAADLSNGVHLVTSLASTNPVLSAQCLMTSTSLKTEFGN